jgi:hypothetical protein
MAAMTEKALPPRERNWDAFAAVIAAFIGLLALLVSGYTAYLQRKQTKAQVWPRIELGRYGGGSFVAENTGVGPARVKAVRVTVDGRARKHWAEVMQAIGYQGHFIQSQISRRVLQPGKPIEVLEAPKGEEGRQMFDLVTRYFVNDGAEHRIGMLICYCSVFDDCWMTAMGQVGDVKLDTDEIIDRCPIAENEKFYQ